MRYLTIVYAVPDNFDVRQLTGHDLVSAMSWCHAIDEKNRVSDVCSICGRPPHVCDDPECVPANAPLAEKVRFLENENEKLRVKIDSFAASMKAAAPALRAASMFVPIGVALETPNAELTGRAEGEGPR